MKTQTKSTKYQIKNLLSPGTTNAKTGKNQTKTFILYLAPHKQNSFNKNLCSKASPGCIASCLFTAGRGKFSNVQIARIRKADYFLEETELFINQLASEILKQYAKAKKNNYQVLFRLNGTSDIDFYYLLIKYASLDITKLKDYAQFYEYTKNINYIKSHKHKENLTYTFSRSETNNSLLPIALKLGANVSVVFKGEFPKKLMGYDVLNGDSSDEIMIGHKSKILGLQAKGDAKKDKTNFVIDTKKLW